MFIMKYEDARKKYPHVFSPLRVKNILYDNRLCSTPMAVVPTHTHLSMTNYGGIGIYDKALGGSAMIAMTYHGKGGVGQYEANGANPFENKYELDPLRESLSVVKAGGALAGLVVGMGNMYDGVHYSPSGLPFARPYARPTQEVTEDILYKLLEAVIEKARKAKDFGFDLLILDICCENMVTLFMAPGFNHRTDKWGGSYENRFRLAHLIVDKIREAIGVDFVFELRISATMGVEESYPFEEMLKFIKSVEQKIDIINILSGMDEYHDGNTQLCPVIFEKHMLNYDKAKAIKESCDVIVNVSGSIMNAQDAEKIIADGAADLVIIGRSIVADPYWPKKVMEDREEDIVPCIRCNNCYHISTEHFNTCCSVNPRIYRENRVPLKLEKSDYPKKVVIIGAGPAGMKVALTVNEKGHDVTLIDKNRELGGQLIIASKGVLKEDLNAYLRYLKTQVTKSSIEVKLNTEATPELVSSMSPDVLIIATGAYPALPKIDGIDSNNVVHVTEVLQNDFQVDGDHIAILGGGSVGCELAIELSYLGKRVTIIEQQDALAKNGNVQYRAGLLRHLSGNDKINSLLNTSCLKIKNKQVIIEQDGQEQTIDYDTLVIACGFKNDISKIEQFYGIALETRYVGDCKKPASVTEATTEGYFLGSSI